MLTPEFWQRLARAETHPTRMAIVDTLAAADGVLPASTLSSVAKVGGAAIDYHLKALRTAGLIELDHSEPRDGGRLVHHYRLGERARA